MVGTETNTGQTAAAQTLSKKSQNIREHKIFLFTIKVGKKAASFYHITLSLYNEPSLDTFFVCAKHLFEASAQMVPGVWEVWISIFRSYTQFWDTLMEKNGKKRSRKTLG